MNYWWLSFADETGSLGVAVIAGGENIVEAAQLAWELGCNPGGQVAALLLHGVTELPEHLVGRLITRTDPELIELQLAVDTATPG